jgi:hypothetical protein
MVANFLFTFVNNCCSQFCAVDDQFGRFVNNRRNNSSNLSSKQSKKIVTWQNLLLHKNFMGFCFYSHDLELSKIKPIQ